MTWNESVNTDDINGAQSYASITDCNGFFDVASAWGRDGGEFPSADARGACVTGTCRIWSLAPRVAADDPLLDFATPPTGDRSFVPREDGSSTTTALADATELSGDLVGDDDGLCEANERCLFHPNPTGHQGHGALQPLPYSAGRGRLVGITLIEHATNGYLALPIPPRP